MTDVKRKPGRPPLESWTQRAFLEKFDHHDFSVDLCWTPKPGARVNPDKTSVAFWDDVLDDKRVQTVRRFVWVQVMKDEHDHDPLGWADVMVASDNCTDARCINPHHQVRLSREEHADRLRQRFSSAGRQGAVAQDAARTARRVGVAVEEAMARYVAGRLVLLGSGNALWAAEAERRTDTSDAFAEALRSAFLERYPRYNDAFAATPAGRDAVALAKRRAIVEHFYKTYPETRGMVQETGADQYLQMAWSGL